MESCMKKFTINGNESTSVKGSLIFEVTDEPEQLEITFEVDNPAWIQIFVKNDSDEVGQALLTHQQRERIIRVGKENSLSSPTITPQKNLEGEWEVSFIAKPYFPESAVVTIQVKELRQGIVDPENEMDIFDEESKGKKGWVKGDLHTHTHFSDGQMSRSENLVSAKNQQLDFFFATEHNLIVRQWPRDDEVLIFPGIELTSDVLGHCNYLGVMSNHFSEDDYEKLADEAGMLDLLRQNKHNGLLSINHPYLKPWEWNTDLPLNLVTSLEVINDPTYQDNTEATKEAFDLWSRLWNKGVKITGVGGSDSHLRPDDFYPGATSPSLIGDPGTYVYVEEIDLSNVLDAIKNGHTKISRIGEIQLSSKDKPNILPGEQVPSSVKHFKISLPNNSKNFTVDWILDGEVVRSENTSVTSEIQIEELDDQFHWLRADVWEGNEIVATFNPVYWNDKKPEITMLKEVL